MGSFSVWHWLIVLVVVVLIFGTKKLRTLGSDLGGAVRGFKEGMREGETPGEGEQPKQVEEKRGQTVEGEVKDKTHTNV